MEKTLINQISIYYNMWNVSMTSNNLSMSEIKQKMDLSKNNCFVVSIKWIKIMVLESKHLMIQFI